MSTKYYIKKGKRYELIGYDPHFIADGMYLVTQHGRAYQRVMKLNDLKDTYPYSAMAKDIPELAGFLRAHGADAIGGTLQMRPEGSYQYQFPANQDMAEHILKFLAMTTEERKEVLKKMYENNHHLDREGNVVDLHSNIVFTKYSKEAYAAKLEDLRKQVAEYERVLGKRLLDDL